MAGRYTWMELRAVSSTNDTGLAADKCDWDSIKDLPNLFELPGPGDKGQLQLLFKGAGSAGQVMDFCLYLVKNENCPAECVVNGTATLGVTGTGKAGEYYANKITISNYQWMDPPRAIDGFQYDLGTGLVTNGGIAKLVLDGSEYQYALLFMANATTSQCGADVSNFY